MAPSALIQMFIANIQKTQVAAERKWRLNSAGRKVEIREAKGLCPRAKLIATIDPSPSEPEINITFHGLSQLEHKLAIKNSIKEVASNSHIRLLTTRSQIGRNGRR